MKIRSVDPNKIPRPHGEWPTLPCPWPSTLDLEVGCGAGWHPVQYALNNPRRHLIAIERTHEKHKKFIARLKNHPEVKNLTPVHADALAWAQHFLPSQSVDRLILLYPNPYPKKSQAHRRWHLAPGLQCLLSKLKPGGQLQYATNFRWLCDEAIEAFQSHWGLADISMRVLTRDDPPRTHFEKKYLLSDQLCYEILATKDPSPPL